MGRREPWERGWNFACMVHGLGQKGEGPQQVSRDPRFPSFEARDLKAKSGLVSGFKVWLGGGMPKITLGITRLHEILGRYYGIEELFWVPRKGCPCVL